MSNASLKRKLDSSNVPNSVPNRSQILNDKLSRRPDRHELIQQGILYDSQCAPSLQYAEHALKRARLADELNNHLINRPGPLELVQNKILHIDTNEHPNLEQAIQGGTISFKTTSSYRRPLIFHEYTGPPSSSKPKITKVESPSSPTNAHQIRLAQQKFLLELTSDKQEEQQSLSPQKKPLEQMTLIQLRDVCKQYQIPSSHANKTKLIQRIKQAQNKQEPSVSTTNSVELSNADIIASLQISDINEEEIDPFSPSELDEILKYFPINREEEQTSNVIIDFDYQNLLTDCQTTNSDDLFVQMLLDNDYTSPSTTFDDLFVSDLFSPSSSSSFSLPKITSADEFDAFLHDFTHNLLSYQQEVSAPI